MENLSDFLKQFNISPADFESTGLNWGELLKIKADYEDYIPDLTPPANYLIDAFHNVKTIHSVRFRLKSPTHFIEKIIRKKIEDHERVIDINNYRNEITDLIGLRALHLFKEDWIEIHDFIKKNWNLHEDPIAYYRSGDSPEYIEVFKKHGCIVKEHPHGYRSVHYIVETSPSKSMYLSEVQVRTIFEEGWSEIDHKIRYPYDKNNRLLSQFLVMFNRLSGNADEMGSYIQYLKRELDDKEKEHKEAVDKKIAIIDDLKQKVKDLELKPKVALQWESELNEILKLPLWSSNDLEFKIPVYPNIEFPDFSGIKFPDHSSMKLTDWGNMKMPSYSDLKVPDNQSLKFPENQNNIVLSRSLQHPEKDAVEKPKTTKKRRNYKKDQ